MKRRHCFLIYSFCRPSGLAAVLVYSLRSESWDVVYAQAKSVLGSLHFCDETEALIVRRDTCLAIFQAMVRRQGAKEAEWLCNRPDNSLPTIRAATRYRYLHGPFTNLRATSETRISGKATRREITAKLWQRNCRRVFDRLPPAEQGCRAETD